MNTTTFVSRKVNRPVPAIEETKSAWRIVDTCCLFRMTTTTVGIQWKELNGYMAEFDPAIW